MNNYKIYINDKRLLISKKESSAKEKVQYVDKQYFNFKTFYKNLKKDSNKTYLLISEEPKETFREIKKACLLIRAAGGLVENGQGRHLFIFRNKRWDLPKGKVEKDEKMKKAALREVEEECGIKIDKLHKKICKTYHVYQLDSKIVLKKTNWYKMYVKGVPTLKPQKEEGITSAVWVEEGKIKNKIKNTFPLILDVLTAGKIL